MMVTFVSMCEKNALKKTRRVLDAFANRIGDNTWQTVITQEGLGAVKKLLRKSASKSTAVSCHWIRSRSRSELVWVVGKRDKFNDQGVVPVNVTEKEVPMDILNKKPIKGIVYANTQLQHLDHHLFAVGFVAQQLYFHFYPNKTAQANAAFIAGCFHDIGKIDPKFQEWVIKPTSKKIEIEDGQHIDKGSFSFKKHPRHNEISTLIFQLIDDKNSSINPHNKHAIKHAIYWHHAKPFRDKEKDEFSTYGQVFSKLNTSIGDAALSLVTTDSIAYLNKVSNIEEKFNKSNKLNTTYCQKEGDVELLNNEHIPMPLYKDYQSCEAIKSYKTSIDRNSNHNIIRACVISADRWVSSLSAQELADHLSEKTLNDFVTAQLDSYISIETDLSAQIKDCLSNFPDSKRSKQQSEKANELCRSSDKVKVLAGAAGCGKTKIALEWAMLRGAHQIIWVCPRVQICQGMFNELKASDDPYFRHATVEIYTGEHKYTDSFNNPTPEDKYLTADIVITTIDQLLGSIVSHSNADRLLNYLNAHIVFDEYHEYIPMPAFNLLFAELVTARNDLSNGANILLVSATPHYFYTENILNIDKDYDIVEMPSFNEKLYQFDFCVYDENMQDNNNPLYNTVPNSTFVISNTAITAQKSFIQNQTNENAILLHSKYKKSDKQRLFELVFNAFKRDGTREFDLLRSGPIVQASLNISCKAMVSEITTPENLLQRMGRLDRFGESDKVNVLTVAIPQNMHDKKGSGAVTRFLGNTNTLQTTKAWYEYLCDKTDNGKNAFSIAQAYQYYVTFYQDPSAKKWIESDMIAAMKKSSNLIGNKVSEPKIMMKNAAKQTRAKIGSNSLRGNSRFVQMAVCDVNEYKQPQFIEEYAYQVPTSERQSIDNLTTSVESITGYGDSDKDLLAHMKKKHHNITGDKKAHKDFILLNDAKDPEFPVYLSYTPNDLLAVGGEVSRHSEAIYYGVCEKQPVGMISIKNLT